MENENKFIGFLKIINNLLPNIGLEIEDVSDKGEDGNGDADKGTDGQNQTNETLLAQKAHWKDKATKYETEVESIKKELEELKGKSVKTEPNKPNNENKDEVDYSKIAYLNSVDVKHPDDQKIVAEEAERLKLPLTDVLNMPHMKEQLKAAHNQRKVEEGIPKGDGTPGSKTKGDVDYWVNKKNKDGSYVTPEDSELAAKVIEARMKREDSKNMFDPIR